MAVTPTVIARGNYTIYEWVLTSADDIAISTPPIGHRNDKTIDMNENTGGFSTDTLKIHGDIQEDGPGFFKLCNSIPDTQLLSFTANTTTQFHILPNVNRVRPVRTAGTLGINGVRITLHVTSGRELAT